MFSLLNFNQELVNYVGQIYKMFKNCGSEKLSDVIVLSTFSDSRFQFVHTERNSLHRP